MVSAKDGDLLMPPITITVAFSGTNNAPTQRSVRVDVGSSLDGLGEPEMQELLWRFQDAIRNAVQKAAANRADLSAKARKAPL